MSNNYQLSENFSAKEFVCRCGNCELSDPAIIYKKMNPILIGKIQKVREIIRVPMIITSGARCGNRHIEIYKERYGDFWRQHIVWGSQHLVHNDLINASDFVCSCDLFFITMVCASVGLTCVGWYQRKMPDGLMDYFVHSDVGGKISFYRKVYNF